MDSDGTDLTFHLGKTLREVYGDLLFQEQKDIYLQMQGNKFQVHLVLENGRFTTAFKPLDFLLNLPPSSSGGAPRTHLCSLVLQWFIKF